MTPVLGATDRLRVSARVARRGKIKTVDKNGRRSLGSLADDDDDDDDDARSARERRAPTTSPRHIGWDAKRRGERDAKRRGQSPRQSPWPPLPRSLSLSACGRIHNVESVAAALKTLVTHASPTTALAAFDAATDVGDRYFASLAAESCSRNTTAI